MVDTRPVRARPAPATRRGPLRAGELAEAVVLSDLTLVAAIASQILPPPISSALLVVAVTFIFLDWLFVLRVLPDFERYKPVPGFARTLCTQPGSRREPPFEPTSR